MNAHTSLSSTTRDMQGLRCPHLLIAVIGVLRDVPLDAELTVLADDLNAPSSLTAWIRQSGNELREMYDENGVFTFVIQRQI